MLPKQWDKLAANLAKAIAFAKDQPDHDKWQPVCLMLADARTTIRTRDWHKPEQWQTSNYWRLVMASRRLLKTSSRRLRELKPKVPRKPKLPKATANELYETLLMNVRRVQASLENNDVPKAKGQLGTVERRVQSMAAAD